MQVHRRITVINLVSGFHAFSYQYGGVDLTHQKSIIRTNGVGLVIVQAKQVYGSNSETADCELGAKGTGLFYGDFLRQLA